MIPVERQRTIMRMLREQGTLTIAELVDKLDVSHMTIRRDIAALERAGRVTSVARGVALPSRLNLDLGHSDKAVLYPGRKAAIARVASQVISPGDVVFLDAGTTTLALAMELTSRDDLVIVTNDLIVAQVLAERSRSEIHLAAGQVDRANLSTEGRSTADAIAKFNFDISFISTPAFDLRGTSIQSEAKNIVKDTAVAHAHHSYLVADSSKYGRVMPLKSVPLFRFEGVVTDEALSDSARTAVEEAGVRLLLAQISEESER